MENPRQKKKENNPRQTLLFHVRMRLLKKTNKHTNKKIKKYHPQHPHKKTIADTTRSKRPVHKAISNNSQSKHAKRYKEKQKGSSKERKKQ